MNKYLKYIPFVFAVVFVLIAITSVSYKSHTRDENRHLVRGVMLLETGDYRLNKHHPILANVLAAIPQLFNNKLVVPSTKSELWNSAAKDEIAEEFVQINGGKRDFAFNILNPSRYFMIVVFTLCSLWMIFEVRKDFGEKVSNIFAFLYFLSPNIIANAQLVTTDALIVPLSFLSTLYLYRYAKNNNRKTMYFFVGVTFLALITKYSVLPLVFLWTILLFVIEFKHYANSKRKFIKSFGTVVLSICIWLLLLTAVYGFRFRSLESTNYEDTAKTESNLFDLANMLKYTPSLIDPASDAYRNLKLPFPEYIHGFLDNVVFHNAYGHDTYLAGQYSKTGWWYYFPFAMAIKMPIPVVIGGVAILILSLRFLVVHKKFDPFKIFIITGIFFMLLSMASSLNLGIRHVLIIFPFIYLGISLFVEKTKKIKPLKYSFIILAVWYMGSSLLIYPFYLEYFNEFVGGPQNGHYYLLDSNLSWAQNDFLVEDYIDDLNTDKEIFVNPLEQKDSGIIIIDVDLLMGRDVNKRPKTQWLRDAYLNEEIKPIDRIGYTHLVFDL